MNTLDFMYLVLPACLLVASVLKVKDLRIVKFLLFGGLGIGALRLLGEIFNFLPNQTIAVSGLMNWVKLDALSITMDLMVTIIGLVVIHFSQNYLSGNQKLQKFYRRLIPILAFVKFFLISSNLLLTGVAWILSGIQLQRLIAFNQDESSSSKLNFLLPRKRIPEISMLLLVIISYFSFGTFNYDEIFGQLNEHNVSTVLLVIFCASIFLTVVSKSVQLPFHGWLPDLLNAPTSISALIHAGILNAGPYLLLRFSAIPNSFEFFSTILILLSGITALYGTILYHFQPTIKLKLVYSSIGHMGFSFFLIGIGLYPAAVIHLIGHSLYKANSFLLSGSEIDQQRLQYFQHKESSSIRGLILNATFGVIMSILILQGLEFIYPFHGVDLQQHLVFQLILIIAGAVTFSKLPSIQSQPFRITSGIISLVILITSFYFLETIGTELYSGLFPQPSANSGFQEAIILGIFCLLLLAAILLRREDYNKYPQRVKAQIRNSFYL